MFGFFNKTKKIKVLTGLLLLQNDILQDLVNILRDMNGRQEPTRPESILDTICGEWSVKDIGICLSVRKENNNYYASVRDLNGPDEDYREPYPVREYKDICYFILDSYAIFIEFDRDKNRIKLCGNLSLVRLAADIVSCPAVPLNINPN